MRNLIMISMIFLSLPFSGCSTDGVRHVSGDTYAIDKSAFSPEDARMSGIQVIEMHCQKSGLQYEIIGESVNQPKVKEILSAVVVGETRPALGVAKEFRVTLTFRCLQ